MNYLIIPLVAVGASLLTFFSGFGLGTLLTPAFVLFFPINLSIGLTAIVHLLTNLFKLLLVGRYTNQEVLIRFCIPAILFAFLGAWTLTFFSHLSAIYTYELGSRTFEILPIKLLVAVLMVTFTLFDLIPGLKNLEIDKKYLSVGGALSGFFGGLSGHQGALRSAFLARSGLTKEQFIGTRTVIACLVDFARLIIYSQFIASHLIKENVGLLFVTTLAAFVGAYSGSRLLKSITMRGIQMVVSISLFVLALALGMGII